MILNDFNCFSPFYAQEQSLPSLFAQSLFRSQKTSDSLEKPMSEIPTMSISTHQKSFNQEKNKGLKWGGGILCQKLNNQNCKSNLFQTPGITYTWVVVFVPGQNGNYPSVCLPQAGLETKI